ncbi:helix-turn-helix domain-containing protein [Luteolibacter sp. Populi]|uniref:helix-turn-helix domain-containing protein n=1 Tax=Luteolibacter sp. Populi TaxID=3230487 RepID=UPI0034670542
MDLKIEFALKAIKSADFKGPCAEYGISRKTGYKWQARFLEHGMAGMEDRSRRPHASPDGLAEAVVCEIVKLKQAHPHWGPRKIRALYGRKHAGEIPCESSFKRVLEHAGLTVPRKTRAARDGGRIASGLKAEKPNEIWTIDFKGWWLGADGQKVEPLTVRDEHSKMLLEMRALESSRTAPVRACFERLFELHGLPGAIRSDNGPPFATHAGLLGLSKLSCWWLALGIGLERSRPGCPQDNGAHERMHLDISRELQAGRIGRDQAAFDVWRHEYNHERPHESLGMKMPAEIYIPSARRYEGTPDELDYGGMETRRVNPRGGTISHRGEKILISTALGGWSVGLSPRPDGLIEVWFAGLLVGHLDETTASFAAARPGGGEAGQPVAEVSP